MNQETADEGAIEVLMERLVKQRLPRALELKDRVDGGATHNEFDIAFLEQVFADGERARSLFMRHPELHEIGAKMGALYLEITERALQNEKQKAEQ